MFFRHNGPEPALRARFDKTSRPQVSPASNSVSADIVAQERRAFVQFDAEQVLPRCRCRSLRTRIRGCKAHLRHLDRQPLAIPQSSYCPSCETWPERSRSSTAVTFVRLPGKRYLQPYTNLKQTWMPGVIEVRYSRAPTDIPGLETCRSHRRNPPSRRCARASHPPRRHRSSARAARPLPLQEQLALNGCPDRSLSGERFSLVGRNALSERTRCLRLFPWCVLFK